MKPVSALKLTGPDPIARARQHTPHGRRRQFGGRIL